MHIVRRVSIFPTKILLATDGSREASLAEDAAVELSNGTGSELHVVHVARTTPELPYPRSLAKERSESLVEWRKLGGLKLLDDRVRRIENLGAASRRRTTRRETCRGRSSVSVKSSTLA